MAPALEVMSEDAGEVNQNSTLNSQDPSYSDLLETIRHLLDDRDGLSRRLKLAERTIQELNQQARYANKLVRHTQSANISAQGSESVERNSREGKPSTWIGGSWLAPSEEILAPAEEMWQDGNAQQALILVEPLLRRHDLTVSEDINTHLFISAILRASGDAAQASKYAEDALVIANHADAYLLASKAEFHRGLSYLKQNQFAQAHWCLTLASHLEGHQDQVEANRVFAEEKYRNSVLEDPGRRLDLHYI
ncbi:MAG: hypothetical protein Q9219_002755 [cf. Caloplaca sp. 3 TL-2023]